MSLKPCRECGQPVAATAKTCPHCGINSPGNKIVAFGDATSEAGRAMMGCGCLMLLIPAILLLLGVCSR